jgi:hypothetical protein
MNTSQLLEVATKVFVDRDQKTKWEPNRKIKKKVDFFAVVLAEQLGGPSMQAMAEEQAIPVDSGQHYQNGLTIERS